MSKPTVVYAVMLIACAGGMWGILHAGASLSAVTDLTGTWQIDGGPLGPVPGGPDTLGGTFAVEQSGRFVRVRFDRGRVLDLKAVTVPAGKVTHPTPVEFTDGTTRLTGTLGPAKDGGLAGSFTLVGPKRTTQFLAHRPGAKVPEAKPEVRPQSAGQTPQGPPATGPDDEDPEE
ncbi:MAG TPA: hypothetical protein VF796_21175 [Humisphaera sp.]